MFMQIVSLAGAAFLLGAFGANSRGWLRPQDRIYGVMNLIGALLLLWVAVVDLRWGFIILEVAWAAVSIPAIVTRDADLIPKP